jgi:hypothetical protein
VRLDCCELPLAAETAAATAATVLKALAGTILASAVLPVVPVPVPVLVLVVLLLVLVRHTTSASAVLHIPVVL